MKLNKILTLAAGALLVASCNDIDEQYPQDNNITADQLQETTQANPERINATFSGMFTMMMEPYAVSGASQGRADDFGYGSMAVSQDAEGADFIMMDNDYNWFSTCGEMSSRDASYANPLQRYKHPYTQIGICNQVIASYPEDTQDQAAIYNMAQAHAMRAFAYMQLAPYFAFDCASHPDDLCIPILRDGVDYANNPRATNKEVWEYIIEDLDYAVKNLAGFERPNKMQIDQKVAYGLRARANLAMGNWKAAADDADEAMKGYEPASIEEVSHPTFCKIDEHNWMWGYIMTDKQVTGDAGYASVASWISAFSWNGYAAATENVPMINVLLYNKIPATDVRKHWWLDANKQSPLLDGLEWGTTGVKGQAIADWVDPDGNKLKFPAYGNVKFGMKAGIGSTTNSSDWPFMRVEEMYLIKAEGLAKSGNEKEARDVLEYFVKNYRDPSYSSSASTRSLADEIWFQRRVELWGEGFFTADMKRLGKPLVRFHADVDTNVPDAFKFNMQANDPWLNMRFSKYEYEYNKAIIDNKGGNLPEPDQEPALRDGVTD
ncbi:MAG: RagB/SusD family nutrient uptake outer membrane protein [Bacteroidaceae bacterium]|nr:RagB/SusD family nutrient uptake outer membrane protein [Bacteroidaceae bacterium]